MSIRQSVIAAWVGVTTVLWTCQPLVFSQARGVIALAMLTGFLATLGGIWSVLPLVVWSGGVGLLNLTLALLLTSAPPHLWAGLSAGCLLLALLDGNQCLAYVRRCEVGSGVLPALGGTIVRLCGVSLLAGLGVGYLVTTLASFRIDTTAAGYLTLLGAGLFVGCFVAFVLVTGRWAAWQNLDDAAETDD